MKLAKNPEARRAIVSQVIAYAAFLQNSTVKGLEQGPLRKALADSSYDSILDAASAQDQEGAVDEDSFPVTMQEHLDRGDFRLVFVLDEVSTELTRMVAYLDSITVQALTIDLITVKVYEVNGAQIALPQRVSPDIAVMTPAPNPAKPKAKGIMSDGVDAFRASIEDAAGEARKTFDELIARAEEWASLPNVRVRSYASIRPGEYTLLPKIMPDNAGLVTIWNDNLQPSIAFWRSVFERRAPKSLEAVERVMGPLKIGKWKSTKDITPELIDAITKAYEEANDG